MPRTRSEHTTQVKAQLTARLNGELVQPGSRFLSARAVAQRYGVSYQTAHRLLGELAAEGLLERRTASGSYVPGTAGELRGVQLLFNERARRAGSFGAHLLELLAASLGARKIDCAVEFVTPGAAPEVAGDRYPVIWECPQVVEGCAARRQFALCLNDRPPPGLSGSHIDAVSTDDYCGGACAADLLRLRSGSAEGLAVLGGPVDDPRSQQRVAGFTARAPAARIFHAGSWYAQGALPVAADLLAAAPRGVFACNDRLGEALIQHYRAAGLQPPLIVGFDNAPVAETLRLTTIGIPWRAMVAEASALIQARLAGSLSPARLVILPHEAILRLSA